MNSKEEPLWKNCFIEAPETHPDILHGGHRNPYQLKNAIKNCCDICLLISLGVNSIPGSCEYISKESIIRLAA